VVSQPVARRCTAAIPDGDGLFELARSELSARQFRRHGPSHRAGHLDAADRDRLWRFAVAGPGGARSSGFADGRAIVLRAATSAAVCVPPRDGRLAVARNDGRRAFVAQGSAPEMAKNASMGRGAARSAGAADSGITDAALLSGRRCRLLGYVSSGGWTPGRLAAIAPGGRTGPNQRPPI